MEKLKALFIKYKEQILYLVFGVLTTLTNFVVFFLFSKLPLGKYSIDISTWVAWLASVIFAYITNRIWVFESKAATTPEKAKEFFSFVGARVFSGIVDYIIMLVGVKLLGANELVVKLLSNVIVIILNYILSKVFVFRKKK